MSTLIFNEAVAREYCRASLLPYGRPRLLQCVARKKYSNGEMTMGTIILERVILHFDKGQVSEDKFIRELRKFDVLANAGLYTDPKGNPIQLGWIVAYITAYPLDEDEAADGFVNKVLEFRKDQRRAMANAKPHVGVPRMEHLTGKMTTLLHQHCSKEWRMLKLDVDTKDPVLIKQLQESMIGAVIVMAAETRGGYHVVLDKGPCCRALYDFARAVNNGVPKEDQWITIENNSGPMYAIPGTSQGGFEVKIRTEMWQQAVQQNEAL